MRGTVLTLPPAPVTLIVGAVLAFRLDVAAGMESMSSLPAAQLPYVGVALATAVAAGPVLQGSRGVLTHRHAPYTHSARSGAGAGARADLVSG